MSLDFLAKDHESYESEQWVMNRDRDSRDAVCTTERLYMRLLTLNDADNLLGIYSDPIAMKHFASTRDREQTIEGIKRNLARYEEDGHGFWACVRKADDAYLGNCGLLKQEVNGEFLVEVGYHFLRAHWGNGYAIEAAIACRDHAFKTLDVDRVISLITPANEPSVRVAQRNGMTLDGQTRKWDFDLGVYMISRAEWQSLVRRDQASP